MFGLCVGRATSLAVGAFLPIILATRVGAQALHPIVEVRTLSAFEMAKAESLLRGKLPCLGCHELGGEGGRIGPSLSNLAATRPPDYVFAMISDPQSTVPGVVMPRVPLTRKYAWTKARFDFQLDPTGAPRIVPEQPAMAQTTLELIGNYLLQREPGRGTAPELIPRPPPAPLPESADGATLYRHYCADCHGAEGGGDGPNAKYLPVPPVSHADASYMSERPDDSLFDAIYSGGYIMNLSPRMPPYGATLTREQIWSLVGYLRILCDCQGPAWSRDGKQ
jgi:mono/diheme cytochrome c family protein